MSERQQSRSRVNTGSSSAPQIEIQGPPPRRAMREKEPRDTGFPEPLDKDRNTTLPHPDADLSPNASLSSDDVSTPRTIKRDRLAFLKKNNKRTVSHGTLPPRSEPLHGRPAPAPSTVTAHAPGEKSQNHRLFHAGGSSASLQLSKDGQESVRSGSKKAEDETPPTSPDVSEHRRKSGLFNRWKRN
ncbi:hypothetical protein E4U42_003496 [Claviceps africana]|uniref:Uncharacterized protein n=1 Tax=Claviceps africana TaxID=83212 RepID=A0A8K0J961_9HYPO|nr:hypothetical protein E4U42_003496 [Claviceps africana]